MKTTPAIYYRYFVEPNWHDFQDAPTDVRLGFNAAVAAFHMSDVFYEHYREHDAGRLLGCRTREQFLMELTRRAPEFITVQTAATVYKHLHTAKLFLDASSPMAFEGVAAPIEGVTIRSQWRPSNAGFVRVRKKSGGRASLNDALRTVVERLWPELLGDDLFWV